MRELSAKVKAEMAQADGLRNQLDELLLRVPNVFHESVPAARLRLR